MSYRGSKKGSYGNRPRHRSVQSFQGRSQGNISRVRTPAVSVPSAPKFPEQPCPRIERVVCPQVANHKGNSVQIDPLMPREYDAPLCYHEQAEDALMEFHGLSYQEAHERATELEKEKFFPNDPEGWKCYMSWCTFVYEVRHDRPATKPDCCWKKS